MPRANSCKQGLEIFFLVSQLRIPTPCLCLCHYSLQIRELLCHSSALSISHRHPGRPTVTNIWQNTHSNSFYTHVFFTHVQLEHTLFKAAVSIRPLSARSVNNWAQSLLGHPWNGSFHLPSKDQQSLSVLKLEISRCPGMWPKSYLLWSFELVLFHCGCSKCNTVHSISPNSDHLCLYGPNSFVTLWHCMLEASSMPQVPTPRWSADMLRRPCRSLEVHQMKWC